MSEKIVKRAIFEITSCWNCIYFYDKIARGCVHPNAPEDNEPMFRDDEGNEILFPDWCPLENDTIVDFDDYENNLSIRRHYNVKDDAIHALEIVNTCPFLQIAREEKRDENRKKSMKKTKGGEQ